MLFRWLRATTSLYCRGKGYLVVFLRTLVPLLRSIILLSKATTNTPFRRLNMASDDLLFYAACNIYTQTLVIHATTSSHD